jgi:hypothetical protein
LRWNSAVGGFIYNDKFVPFIAGSYRMKLCFSITNAKVHKKMKLSKNGSFGQYIMIFQR